MLITIGAFDGFHKGHMELMEICRRESEGDNWGVVTFDPHPLSFRCGLEPLFTLREREIIRRFLAIPSMIVLKFDDNLMKMSPLEFWNFLKNIVEIDGIVVGRDFHFGYRRDGDADILRGLADTDGVKRVIIADLLDKPRYSSSTVRECISAGDIETAYEILGYPFFMVSRVLHGDERGRTMNYPTANLDIKGRVIPGYGVYAAAVMVKNSWYCGALSVGSNPTFSVNSTRAEVHIVDFDENIYGEEIMIFLLKKVRDIETFSGKEALKLQISADVQECREIYEEMMKLPEIKSFKHFSPEVSRFYKREMNGALYYIML